MRRDAPEIVIARNYLQWLFDAHPELIERGAMKLRALKLERLEARGKEVAAKIWLGGWAD